MEKQWVERQNVTLFSTHGFFFFFFSISLGNAGENEAKLNAIYFGGKSPTIALNEEIQFFQGQIRTTKLSWAWAYIYS